MPEPTITITKSQLNAILRDLMGNANQSNDEIPSYMTDDPIAYYIDWSEQNIDEADDIVSFAEEILILETLKPFNNA